MSWRRPTIWLGIYSVVLLSVLVSCGAGGGSSDVPPLPSDFNPGATLPGWVLSPSSLGRDEVGARSWHDGQRWNVLMARSLPSRPRDTVFGFALSDDSDYHVGLPAVRLTFEPGAAATPNAVPGRPVANGQVVVDGTFDVPEWDPGSVAFLTATSQSTLPVGAFPTAPNTDIIAAAAYDEEYVYFLFQWIDASTTRSDLGAQLQWDGSQWVRRPHAANDVNGNGILDPSETMTVTATAENEDRFSLFFPIQDQGSSYIAGGTGCATSCHGNAQLDPAGFEAVHALVTDGDLVDVWSWGAARNGASLRAMDRLLTAADPSLGRSGGGSGFAEDLGLSPSVPQGFPTPDFMFAMSPLGPAPLISAPIDFSATTPPGYPVPGPVSANAAAYVESAFNGTPSSPQGWTGNPPFGDDYLPAWVARPATESAADVEAAATYSAAFGLWTLEFRRRRITRDGTGAPRPDDVQFEEDADFARPFQAMAADGLPFSISITNDARGHGTRESEYRGPLRMSGDPSLSGVLTSDLYIHDYGAGFAPTTAAEFTDGTLTAPIPEVGANVGLELKAGTDGSVLYMLASWDDPTPDVAPDEWAWNGFSWERAGDQDELRILFNVTQDQGQFVQSQGCASMCHSGGGPGLPATPWFGGAATNDLADLWHWQAGRSAPRGVADDTTVDWRFFRTVRGGTPGAAISGDVGPSPYLANLDPGLPHPVWMAPSDPNGGAAALFMGVPNAPEAIPFLDVAGGLPAPTGGGGGGSVSFQSDVLPLFQANCEICHPGFGGLDLTSWSALMMGGASGPVVIPGDPSNSLLIQRLNGTIQPVMPLSAVPLPQSQIQTIANWISEGALDN